MYRWLVAALALLVVIVGTFAPWFRTTWDSSRTGVESNTASAWASSSWWSAAIVLCVLAALVVLLAASRTTRLVHGVAGGVALAAAGMTIWAWRSIPPLELGGGMQWTASPESSGEVGDIVRDNLVVVDWSGLTHEVAWGLYAGVGAMLALALVLAAPALRAGRHS